MKAYRFTENYENIELQGMYLLTSLEPETKKVCQSFNRYGQGIGCYDAGCYDLENDASVIHSDLLIAFDEQFATELHDNDFDQNFQSINEFIELLDDFSSQINLKEAEKFASKWISENTNHSEHKCLEYHDGSNWRTLVISNDAGINDLEELDSEEETLILSAYENIDKHIEGVSKEVSADGYKFYLSRMQGSFDVAEESNSI